MTVGGTERWLHEDNADNSVTIVTWPTEGAKLHVNPRGDYCGDGCPLTPSIARQIAARLIEWANEQEQK